MNTMDEFKGETKEAVTTLKEDFKELKGKVESMDKRLWLIIVLLVVTLAVKAPELTGTLVSKVLALAF